MLRTATLLALSLAASTAHAFDTSRLGQGGSIPLNDLGRLVRQSSQLQHEINEALAAAGKKADEIVCVGHRFPPDWSHLGGARVAPYTCDFNGKWLQIRAAVRLSGADGRVYDSASPQAMRMADGVGETRPSWTWTKTDPNAPKKRTSAKKPTRRMAPARSREIGHPFSESPFAGR